MGKQWKQLKTLLLGAPKSLQMVTAAMKLKDACSFPGGSDGKVSACNARDPGSIPGSERSPGEGNGNPLQYSCLGNPMDREAWQATVHGVAKSWIPQSNFSFSLLLGKKAMTNLDSILKSRDIMLPTKVHLVKAMIFPVVMYGCESWTIKKAEPQRINAFELWCWRRLLRVPWTAGRSDQSILKEISPEYSLEGLMLKLKLQYFPTWCEELTHWKRPWCWKRLKSGGEGDNRGWDCWMASPTQWTRVWASSRSWWWTGRPGVLQSMGSQRVRHDWAT